MEREIDRRQKGLHICFRGRRQNIGSTEVQSYHSGSGRRRLGISTTIRRKACRCSVARNGGRRLGISSRRTRRRPCNRRIRHHGVHRHSESGTFHVGFFKTQSIPSGYLFVSGVFPACVFAATRPMAGCSSCGGGFYATRPQQGIITGSGTAFHSCHPLGDRTTVLQDVSNRE